MPGSLSNEDEGLGRHVILKTICQVMGGEREGWERGGGEGGGGEAGCPSLCFCAASP